MKRPDLPSDQESLSFDKDSGVSITEDLSNKQVSAKSFRVCWWNGGGAIRNRISVNPGLGSLLKTNPDIFVYGESACSNANGLFLSGYRFLFHRSYIKDKQKFRRGLVIFISSLGCIEVKLSIFSG